MKKILVIILSLLIILILIFSSFQYYQKKIQKEKNRIVVATTIGALTAILNELVKDKIEIINLNEGFTHAHEIELTPSHIEKLSKAKIIFTIGYGLDEWIYKPAKQLNIEIFEVSQGITLINSGKKRINPHYWLSLKNAKIIALNITRKLIEIDPVNKNFYIKNLEIFYKKINELEKIAEEIKKEGNVRIILTHPSFDYLAQELGLKIIGYLKTEEGEGISAKEFLKLASAVKEGGVKFILVERGFEDSTVNQFAKLYSLNILNIDPLEISSNDQLYTLTMQENLNKIKYNLMNNK